MRFLVDAQLPPRLARLLSSSGYDAIHTVDLPDGNRTTDVHVAARADADDRVVGTKDRDFRDTHLLMRSPRRLLIVATGNITNDALLALFSQYLDAIVATLTEADYVEIGPDALVMHKRRPESPPS